jgi:GNAT superfamily N-acetyltransferase
MILRDAESADANAVARVHVRSWQVAYRGLLPDAYLDGLRPEDRARCYTFGSADPSSPRTIVAAENGAILGFATVAPARDADALGLGELAALYVDPDAWGRRCGTALAAAARARMVALGFSEALLWVLVGNARAQRIYQIDGWRPDGARRTETVWGVAADEVRYRRSLTSGGGIA